MQIVNDSTSILGDIRLSVKKDPTSTSEAYATLVNESLDLTMLRKQASVSSYSRATDIDKRIIDPTVRTCFEIPADRLKVDFTPATLTRILASLNQLDYSTRFQKDKVAFHVTLDKLLLYDVGGHFDAHLDTNLGKGHVGTLIIGLPCSTTEGTEGYTGGELRFDDTVVKLDSTTDTLHFVAFCTDTVHQVMPVTSGTRVVLQYNVFASEKNEPRTVYRVGRISTTSIQRRDALLARAAKGIRN